jgi:outer membrane protein assembly factor BamB
MARIATLGLVTFGLVVPAPRSLTATLSLSVAVGPPSIRTVAHGSGFGISEVVDISFDSRSVARATTDAAGSFSRKIRVPGGAEPGEHTVEAIGEDSERSAATVFTVRTDWPMERFDQRGSAFNSLENVISPLNVDGLALEWRTELEICAPLLCPQPVVANGLLYATDPKGVHAFDASTGAVVWATNLNRNLVGVTATKDTAFTFSTGAHPTVWALDPLTGDVLWSSVIDGVTGQLTRAIVASGTLFVAATSGSGTLVALDAATGTEVWTMSGGGRFSVPAIAGGVAYTHSGGTLFALDAATGAVIWQVNAGGAGPIDETTTVVDGRVFALTSEGVLQAFDAETGALDWSFQLDSQPGPAVAVANGVVYARSRGVEDMHVDAIDAETGATVWTSSSLAFFSEAAPTVANGLVFIGGMPLGITDCGVCALDARTGEMVWASYGGAISPSYGSPVVVNGMVYAAYYETGEGLSGLGPPIVAFGLP